MVAHVILVHIVGVRIPIGEETYLGVSLFFVPIGDENPWVRRRRCAKHSLRREQLQGSCP